MCLSLLHLAVWKLPGWSAGPWDDEGAPPWFGLEAHKNKLHQAEKYFSASLYTCDCCVAW